MATKSHKHKKEIQLKNLDMLGMDICPKHDKPFEFYCVDEKVLACTKCAFVKHKKCSSLTLIGDIETIDKDDDVRERVKTVMETLSQTMQRLKHTENSLQEDVNQLPSKLDNLKAKVKEMFDEFAEGIEQKASCFLEQKTADFLDKVNDCEAELETMETKLNIIDRVAVRGSSAQKFIVNHQIANKLENDIEYVQALNDSLESLHSTCCFTEQFDKLKRSLLDVTTQDEFEIKVGGVQNETDLKLDQIVAIDLKQDDDDVAVPLYTGLDFLPDGRLVAVDNKNSKCILFDDALDKLASFVLPFNHPKDLTVVSKDEVLITSGNHLRLFSLHLSESCNITLNRVLVVGTSYFSVSTMDDGNILVGTIEHPKPFRIVTESGEEKDFDMELPTKRYGSGESYCTCVRAQKKVVFSDTVEDAVNIYNTANGEKTTVKDELIKAPTGLAVGPNDHVFVCSNGTKALVEINLKGNVLAVHKLGMKFPNSVAVSKDQKRLAVSNAAIRSSKLALYQIL